MKKDETCIDFVEDRPGHDRRYAMCTDKIKTELGWKASTDFNTGIKNTIQWYLSEDEK